MTRTARALRVALGLFGTASFGCAHPWVVQRAYGGSVVEGRYVAPEAYAAFLRGAMAEAEERPVEAIRAYQDAAERDPGSPEPWTRMAEVRCSSGAGADALAGERDVQHALALDPDYAPAWTARAACAAVRGDGKAAHTAAARAAQLDPRGDGASILLARWGDGASASADARAILVALTVTATDPVVAWNALATWARAHGDVALWARALVDLVRLAPERRVAIARSAEALAGAGSLGEARAVAAAAIEAGESPWPADLALAARLAVDEAIARRDVVGVRRRASRGRLPLDEAGGRALLGGERALARELVAADAAADPGAFGARLVLAVADGGDLLGAAASVQPGDTPASPAALIAFGAALLHGTPPDDARAALAAAPRLPLAAGDDRVVRGAVELVSQGALPAAALPPDGALELAVIAGASPALAGASPAPVGAWSPALAGTSPAPVGAWSPALAGTSPAPVGTSPALAGTSPALVGARADPPAGGMLDMRHRYLALALGRPGSPELQALADSLRGVAESDPVVAAAAAIVQLTGGARIPRDAPGALLARNHADPLLAAVALRLAEKVGDADVARRARAALTVLGTTRRTVL